MKVGPIRKILWVVDLGLIVLLVAVSANVLGKPAIQVAKPDISPAMTAPPANRNRLSEQEVGLITNSGVIVPAPISASASAPQPIQKPQAQTVASITDGLGFELVGTIVGGGMPAAIFKDPSGTEVLKVIGDELANAHITGIWEDKVMIERNNQTGYIWLQKPKPGETPAIPAVAVPAPKPTPPPTEVAAAKDDAAAAEADANSAPDTDQTVMSVKTYRDYLQNIGLYINQVTILSHQGPDHVTDGLLLSKVPKESEAYKRGFREGDIIKSVQGQSVTDVAQAQRIAWDILKNEDYVVDVIVVRAGQEEVLTYEIWPE